VDFELFDVLEGQVPASLISIQHASLSSSPSRARNRLKPNKKYSQNRKIIISTKKHTTRRKEAETGKSILETRKLLFQQKTNVS